MSLLRLILLSIFFTNLGQAQASQLVNTIKTIKPSIVGIGIYDPLGAPRAKLLGTGFVVGDGSVIATNYHVVDTLPESQSKVSWAVFSGQGQHPQIDLVSIIATDKKHDLALLKLPDGKRFSAVQLAEDSWLEDGHLIAFTGFPIGEVLGLYPVTHRGMISARTPTIIPVANSSSLSSEQLKLLSQPYYTYQLDATAYPGNSGSPVYLQHSGEVIAIVNKVFVKKTKESVLSDPSNITYAIPVKYLNKLLDSIP